MKIFPKIRNFGNGSYDISKFTKFCGESNGIGFSMIGSKSKKFFMFASIA